MNDLITLVNQSGFPIVISLFLLVRQETTIKQNTKAISEMSTVLQMLLKDKGE